MPNSFHSLTSLEVGDRTFRIYRLNSLGDTGVDLARLRGRSSYPMHVQYAEIALRRHLEEDRLDAVRLLRRQGPISVFGRDGVEWAVTVRRVHHREAQLTYAVERLSPLPVFEVLSIQRYEAAEGPL